MIDRKALKAMAKSQIKGNIGTLFLCTLIIGFIISAAAPIFGAGMIISPAFSISIVMIYIALTQDVKPEIGDIFKGFKILGKALWLFIITGFFTYLWSLLFVIPGIIKGLSYSMAPYILAENPTMTAREALNESKRITNGYKAQLFVLQLSFIGWMFLIPLTFGLISIWLIPYMNATYANFYNAIKGGNQA